VRLRCFIPSCATRLGPCRLGTLVDAPDHPAEPAHLVGSKAPWFTITDDLPAA